MLFSSQLNKSAAEVSQDKYSTYIPPGWTEEKLEDHTDDDIKTLSEEVNISHFGAKIRT